MPASPIVAAGQAQDLSTPASPQLPPRASGQIPAHSQASPLAAPPASGSGTAADAGSGMVTIESDQQVADNRTGIVTALGNVRITYPQRGLTARARQAQYFSREARLVLSGDVEVVDANGQRIRAEQLVYQLDSERLQAQPQPGRQVVSRFRLQSPQGQTPRPTLP
ncbi:MAG: LptA/OstA family protein [Cyanobium sp.]